MNDIPEPKRMPPASTRTRVLSLLVVVAFIAAVALGLLEVIPLTVSVAIAGGLALGLTLASLLEFSNRANW